MPTLDAVDTGSAEEEEWRPVPGFEYYIVSNLGRVKSLARVVSSTDRFGRPYTKRLRTRWLKPGNCRGYRQVVFHIDGVGHTRLLHQIVLLAFVGPRPSGLECRHLDGDRGNNRLDNLQYWTHTENIQDRDRHGTTARHERNGGARLTSEQVTEIRTLRATGISCKTLAKTFNITHGHVHKIIRGHNWRNYANS